VDPDLKKYHGLLLFIWRRINVKSKNEKIGFEKNALLNKSPETTKIALNLDRSSIIFFLIWIQAHVLRFIHFSVCGLATFINILQHEKT